MTKINVLDASVFNLISAGEVVERPASVVKELVENSIDAGATSISVEIKDGGISSILIVDNGCGIDKDNMRLAFLPHATSKLAKAEDLDNIATLGFRGEALASVSAVAQVTMTSKTADDEVGNFITLSAGKVVEEGKRAIAQSTSILVENLFFNTPVRKKFLKKPKQEEANVTAIMIQLALANPEIKFRYTVDNKTVFQTNGGLEEAVYAVYNNEIANGLLPFDATYDNYRVYGYTGNTSIAKHNRNYQTIIINGRVITNQTVSTAVSQAYGNRLMTRTFPVFVINIVMPFDEVDVNVHPTKTDVRFADTHKVFSCVHKAILSTLTAQEQNLVLGKTNTEINIQNVSNEKPAKQTVISQNAETASVKSQYESGMSIATDNEKDKTIEALFNGDKNLENDKYQALIAKQKKVVEELKFNKDLPKVHSKVSDSMGASIVGLYDSKPKNTVNLTQKKQEVIQESSLLKMIDEQLDQEFKVVGQIFNTYLIVESGGLVYFIDQHACHERLIYDRLLDEVNSNNVGVQYMLVPFILDCNNTQYEYISAIQENLKTLGFDIEEFGGLSFKVNSVPHLLNDINLAIFFDELFAERQSALSLKNADLIRDKLAQKACKSAIKAGAQLDNEQIKTLLGSMKNGIPLQCPHGRPAVLSYSRRDFDKLFKRII
ncbi:MAG: DNA mismatch repair endonuclease MutL [Clostridia bacterium]|nr:DNA mismatch repair endonuclease MutL [Clostridia bacterium]